jgi:hypothetical protein
MAVVFISSFFFFAAFISASHAGVAVADENASKRKFCFPCYGGTKAGPAVACERETRSGSHSGEDAAAPVCVR